MRTELIAVVDRLNGYNGDRCQVGIVYDPSNKAYWEVSAVGWVWLSDNRGSVDCLIRHYQAAERRAKMRQLAKTLAALPEDKQAALLDGMGYTTIEGHALSHRNQLMIAYQGCRSAVVGRFQQWRKAGRCVRKGEHGYAIWIPVGQKETDSEDGTKHTTDVCGFMLSTVFGLDQTEPIGASVDSQQVELVVAAEFPGGFESNRSGGNAQLNGVQTNGMGGQ